MMRSFVFLLLLATSAQATTRLQGQAADDFIARHFPNAVFPGALKAPFTYLSHGQRRHGIASCTVPAMGARSDGAVDFCDVAF